MDINNIKTSENMADANQEASGKLITQAHGNGGRLTHELINDIFFKYFNNEFLNEKLDSARIDINKTAETLGASYPYVKFSKPKLAFTTDSYVVNPIFFAGGSIGSLAVTGTINDLIVTGAIGFAITAGFIIEEGFKFSELENIVKTMAELANKNGIKIVSGDTKVVERGACSGIFINTSGIGLIPDEIDLTPEKISKGDAVIITGTPGQHGACILNSRGDFLPPDAILSDCAPLLKPLSELLDHKFKIRVMRDTTRGGLATTLNELINGNKKLGILLEETKIPYDKSVKSFADILGIDLLYSASEGRAVIICADETADETIKVLKRHEDTKNTSIIGHVCDEFAGRTVIKTSVGGKRFLDMQVLEQYPRIC